MFSVLLHRPSARHLGHEIFASVAPCAAVRALRLRVHGSRDCRLFLLVRLPQVHAGIGPPSQMSVTELSSAPILLIADRIFRVVFSLGKAAPLLYCLILLSLICTDLANLLALI